MENSFFKNTNSRLPFSQFQTRCGGSATATFSTPPAQRGQFAEPRMPVGPRLNYGQVYTSVHSSPNTFVQAPFESQQFSSSRQIRPFAAVAQYQPPRRGNDAGEFQLTSWNVNINVPPPPVNVNVPPPPSVNINIPPPSPINRNIPPPGFNPMVPPPPVFNPHCAPPVVAASTNSSALVCRPLVVTNASQPSTFTSRTCAAGAGEQRFGISRQPVSSFINCQRIPVNNVNEPSMSESVVHYRSVQPSCRRAFSNDREITKSSSVASYDARVSESSTVPADNYSNTDGKLLSLSTADDITHSSDDGTAVVAATSEVFVSRSRRRMSARSNITVS